MGHESAVLFAQRYLCPLGRRREKERESEKYATQKRGCGYIMTKRQMGKSREIVGAIAAPDMK